MSTTATRKLQIDIEVNLQQSKQALQQVVTQTAQTAQQITQIDKKAAQARDQIRKDDLARSKMVSQEAVALANIALKKQQAALVMQRRVLLENKAQTNASAQAAKQAETAERRRLAEIRRTAAAESALWKQRERALKEEQRQKDQAARDDKARANAAERAEKRRLAEIRRTAAAEKALYDQRAREIKRAEKQNKQDSRNALLQLGGTLASGYGVQRVASNSIDLAKEGAQAQALDKSFKAIGYTVSDLDKVLTATGYNLDKATVQRMVNLSHSFGFSVEQVTQFADIARAASVKTGQDMKWMFDSIVTGTARQSRLILDNLGILLDLSEAYKTHANVLGKTTDALSDYEKKQAVTNEVLRQGRKFIEQVPRDRLSESIGRTETAFKNMAATMKGAFAQWFVWATSAYAGTAGVSDNLTRLEHKTRKYAEAVVWLRSLQTDVDAKTNQDDIVSKAVFGRQYLNQSLAGFGNAQMQALMQQKAFEEQFLRDTSSGSQGENEKLRKLMDSLDIHTKIREEVEKVLDGTIATEAERRKVAKLLYEEVERVTARRKIEVESQQAQEEHRRRELKALEEEARLRAEARDAFAAYVGLQSTEAEQLVETNKALREHLKARIILSRMPLFAAAAAGLPGQVGQAAIKQPPVPPGLFVGPVQPDSLAGGSPVPTKKPKQVAQSVNALGQQPVGAAKWNPGFPLTVEELADIEALADSIITVSTNTGQDQTATKGTKAKGKKPSYREPLTNLDERVNELRRLSNEDWRFFAEARKGTAWGTAEEIDKAIEFFKPWESMVAEVERERKAEYTAARKKMLYEATQRGLDNMQLFMDTGDYESLGLTKETAIESRNMLRSKLTSEDQEAFNTSQKTKWQQTNDVFGALSELAFNDPEQEKMKAIGDAIENNIAKPANIAADALRDITQGFANAGAAAIWEGKNFKKATNEMLRGIGQQATARAFFEGASALAALAVGNVTAAGLHAKAAAAYGIVAGFAAVGAGLTGGIWPPEKDKKEKKERGVPKARESSDGRNQTVIANTYYISYSGLSSDSDVRRMLFSVMNDGVGNNWLDSRLVEQR